MIERVLSPGVRVFDHRFRGDICQLVEVYGRRERLDLAIFGDMDDAIGSLHLRCAVLRYIENVGYRRNDRKGNWHLESTPLYHVVVSGE